MYICADNMALTAQSCETLQQNFHRIAKWAVENDHQLSEEKTVLMTFRRGGRPATNERIAFNDRPLIKVNCVTLQCKGYSNGQYITDRTTMAIKAIHDIKELPRMSMEAAINLFHLEVLPISTYGLQLIWEHQNTSSLRKLEKVKETYLKKASGLSKHAQSRTVYELTKDPFFIEERD